MTHHSNAGCRYSNLYQIDVDACLQCWCCWHFRDDGQVSIFMIVIIIIIVINPRLLESDALLAMSFFSGSVICLSCAQ